MKKQIEKIILWQDQAKIDEMESIINNLLPLAEKLVTEYFKLPYARPDATINHILNGTPVDAKNYLLSLLPDSFEICGLKLNKEKAIVSKLFDFPSFPEFESALAEAKSIKVEEYEMFLKVQDKTCIINSDVWQLYINQHSIIAKTEDELALHEVWQEFLTASETFNLFLKSHCDKIVFENVSPINLASWALPGDNGGLLVNWKVWEFMAKKMHKQFVN